MIVHHPATYLALGDSYTIGEGVPLHESYPYQLLQLLRKRGQHMHAPEIIAKTGWTTTELVEHLIHTQLEEQYDWVTLLIGVNNHYRGLSVAEFSNDFSFLVHKCIQHCRHQAKGVWLLSIPDWTVTPFAIAQAEQRDRFALADFNEVVRNTATSMGIHHIDITEHSQKVALEPDGLCPDGLHYSGKTHGYWASLLEAGILTAAEM